MTPTQIWLRAANIHRERCRNTVSPCPRRREHFEDAYDATVVDEAFANVPVIPWAEVARWFNLPEVEEVDQP